MASGTAEYDAVIRDIVRYVYYDQITSASAYSRARLALLDALGCAIETVQLSADCRALLGPVVVGATVPITGVRIPGTDYVVDPLKGAFDIGALIRYLDHNDAYAGAEWGHPSDNLGAILSVADWLSQQRSSKGELSITMQTVLTAQIKAYEIQGVLQQTNAFNTRGIDHVVLVKVASTAVVVWMLGLPETAALAAVSHAWVDGHALRTYRQAPNAGPRKGWAAGDACMRAVHLGLLVERANREGQGGLGAMLGMPTAITAPQWGLNDVLLGGDAITQGYPFGSGVVETALFKLMAAEGHGISAVEAAVEVAAQLQKRGLTADQDIESIRIRTQRPAMIIIDKPGGSTKLRNSADRDHSLQYMVAVTLMKRAAVEAVDYLDSAPWATDARVDALQQRITVVEDAGFTADYYDPDVRSVANAISVCLVGGQPLNEVTVAFPIGHHKRAETHAGVVEKFRTNMGLMFSDDEVERIIRAVEDDKTAVNYFMGLFVRKRNRL